MKTSDSARGMLVNYYSNVYSAKSRCTDCRVIELEMVAELVILSKWIKKYKIRKVQNPNGLTH